MCGHPLTVARGAVRDGVAAVEGFAQLLGSRRVALKSIARAIPELRVGCAALVEALGALDQAIAAEVSGDLEAEAVVSEVLARAIASAARLESDLLPCNAPDGSVSIKGRLALEASVRAAAQELHGVIHLSDLLCASLDSRPTPLDLVEVIRQRGSARAPGEPVVRVFVARTASLTDGFVADARVVGGLIELVVALVSRAGVASPHLSASRREDGRVVVRLDARPVRDEVPLDLPLRGGCPQAGAVARVAARRAGVALEIDADGAGATLTV